MAQAVAQDANALVEEQLNRVIGGLEERLKADVLAYSGRIAYGSDNIIRNAIEWRKSQKPTKSALAFFLGTEGGYLEVAQRIANTLRHHYRRVHFYVPDAAMSAGTVLVMSGDSIHMDYYSVLGPIDPQLPKPDGTGYRPAVGYLKKFAELMKKAEKGDLSTAEMAYLCAKFDPAELYDYEHAIKHSVFLLEQWLAKYKFRNWKVTRTKKVKVTLPMKRMRAAEIAEKLNNADEWHSHGHGICMEVLRRRLNLQIEDYGEDAELSELIRNYWSLLIDFMRKLGTRGVIHVKGQHKQIVW
jgi:membrane-bound ClpP family serine protease